MSQILTVSELIRLLEQRGLNSKVVVYATDDRTGELKAISRIVGVSRRERRSLELDQDHVSIDIIFE